MLKVDNNVKLKKLKTTIISSCFGAIFLLLTTPSYANQFGVKVQENNQEKYYLIETKIEKVNRSRDSRIAPVKAKSQLLKYLKRQRKTAEVELKHFSLIKQSSNEKYRVFLFEVKEENIEMK